MTTIKRKARSKVDVGDKITQAWDDGQPPPPEAADPANRDAVGEILFFRWAEVPTRNRWHAPDHPHAAEWLSCFQTRELEHGLS